MPETTIYGDINAASCITVIDVLNSFRSKPDANVNINTKYVTIAAITANIVPFGIAFDGFFKSPLKLAPSMMPVAAGNKIANTYCTLHIPPLHMLFTSFVPSIVSVNSGNKLLFKRSIVNFFVLKIDMMLHTIAPYCKTKNHVLNLANASAPIHDIIRAANNPNVPTIRTTVNGS